MGKKKAGKLVVNLSDDDENDKKEEVVNKDEEEKEEQDSKNNNNDEEEEEDDDDEKVESKGKMIQRHKLEVKKLQQQIDKLNHAIPKKDKKAKSDLLEKTKKMEDELKKKHQQELEQNEKLNETTSSLDQLTTNDTQQPKQPSKAYLKKTLKLKQEEEKIKQLEEDRKNYVSKGVIEMNDFMAKLKPLNKTIKFISPDGDCLYQAITNQLLINNEITSEESKVYAKKLRTIASDYIKGNRDDFLPFIICGEDYSDCEDPIEEYCKEQVLTIGKWGGHIELKALSQSLKKVITVFNAYSNDIVIGEEFTNPIFLSYHRHAFTLGEHYNSVVPQQ